MRGERHSSTICVNRQVTLRRMGLDDDDGI